MIGLRADNDERCTLLVINEVESSWSFRGLDAPRVKLSKADTIALAESILARAR